MVIYVILLWLKQSLDHVVLAKTQFDGSVITADEQERFCVRSEQFLFFLICKFIIENHCLSSIFFWSQYLQCGLNTLSATTKALFLKAESQLENHPDAKPLKCSRTMKPAHLQDGRVVCDDSQSYHQRGPFTVRLLATVWVKNLFWRGK